MSHNTEESAKKNLQTPIRNNNFVFNSNIKQDSQIKTIHGQESCMLLSSSKKIKRNNFSGFKCKNQDCKCIKMDEILKNLIYSPSSNFLFLSPNSMEQYMESFSRERINVMKLIKTKNEKEDNNLNVENKENSNPNSNHNSNKIKSWDKSPKTESSVKNSPIADYSEHIGIITKKNLMKDFEYFQLGIKKKRENQNESDLTERKNSFTLKDIVLNSPEKLGSDCKKKKQIFICSESKEWNEFDSAIKCRSSKSQSLYSHSISAELEPTFFSSQKKNKKRMRKSFNQLIMLKNIYDTNTNKDWTKEMITDISNKIGLPENKVYKWLWDKKNKEEKDKKRFIVHSDRKNSNNNLN